VLGLAIRGPGDTVTARLVPGTSVTISKVSGDQGRLPLDASANTAGIAAIETLRRAGVSAGIELEIRKGMPLGSGLGSSAASAAAAALAVNIVVGSPLRRHDLVAAVVEAESAVAGRHGDNAAPAVLGGLILVRSVDPVDVLRLPVPEGLIVVVVTPAFELATREARAVLPAAVPLRERTRNAANIATFVSACYSGEIGLLGACIEDPVVTPARAALIPGAVEVMLAARAAGCIGTSISGSGPTIFALCHAVPVANRVAAAMREAFRRAGLDSHSVVSPADCPGAREV
jgi:homoserine kinase